MSIIITPPCEVKPIITLTLWMRKLWSGRLGHLPPAAQLLHGGAQGQGRQIVKAAVWRPWEHREERAWQGYRQCLQVFGL